MRTDIIRITVQYSTGWYSTGRSFFACEKSRTFARSEDERSDRPTRTSKKPQILKQKFVFAYFLNRCNIVAIGNGNFKMARKRIALSVDPEYHELLTRLAEYQKKNSYIDCD